MKLYKYVLVKKKPNILLMLLDYIEKYLLIILIYQEFNVIKKLIKVLK